MLSSTYRRLSAWPKSSEVLTTIVRRLTGLRPHATAAPDIDAITAGMGRINTAALLATAPLGEYLLTQEPGLRLLWRISEGEPPDGALEPAEGWTLTL